MNWTGQNWWIMKTRNLYLVALVALYLCLAPATSAFADAIFLTGHDPDYHAALGPNATGAQDIIKVGVSFVTNPALNTFAADGISKFLFVQGNPPPPTYPTDYIDGTLGLAASGYTSQNYDVAGCTSTGDCTQLINALGQLGTKYDALVIGSDFGGSLTQYELNVLDQDSNGIINFLNAGGGLFAMAESDSYVTPAWDGNFHESGGLTPDGGWYGYLPFVHPFGCGGPVEENTLTPYGQSLGLQTGDVQGNYAHNCFSGTYGLNVVDVTGANIDPGAIQTLAGSGYVTPNGVPEPPSLALLVIGLAAVVVTLLYRQNL